MKDCWEILTDKRFSPRFRILNLLSGDILRNWLAVGAYSPILQCKKYLSDGSMPDEIKIAYIECEVENIERTIRYVFEEL